MSWIRCGADLSSQSSKSLWGDAPIPPVSMVRVQNKLGHQNQNTDNHSSDAFQPHLVTLNLISCLCTE